jgi:phosphate-selective porin OprO/OprP
MQPPRLATRSLALVLLLTATASAQQPPPAGTPSSDDAVRRELEELRVRQRWLEHRLITSETKLANEIRLANEARIASENRIAEATSKGRAPVLRFRYGPDGFGFGTADGKNEIRFRLVLHVDGRAYFGGAIPDTFLIRRARPFIEGTLFGIIDYRLMPDFAQGQATLLDAYVELHPRPWLRLRAGRFRSPIGLEWLQSDSTIHLVERSLASDLVPQRDVGVMLSGEVGSGTFCYQIAIFNGAPDGTNGPDFDPQTAKDYVGRIFLHPFRLTKRAALANLGLGVAASYGFVRGTATATNLPTYRSTGQQPIFSYVSVPNAMLPDATATALGNRWRVTPQFYWYLGPVGLLGEYVFSSQAVEHTGTVADIQNRAWNVTASFVMTMEHASFEGVVPAHPVDFQSRSFGALELVLRYSELRIDDAAFPDFADPALSVHQARELAGGVNWYVTDHVRFMLTFHRTDYVGGAVGGDREPENVLLGRLQLAM